jgi:hypothetical protein
MTDTRTEATNATPSTEQFINGLADLMAHSTRTPILRRPDEYGMEYEDVFFPAMDGVTLEGWFIPADSDRLIICNHPMPCNRYGYPGHLEPWTDFGGFEVNFLPEPLLGANSTVVAMTQYPEEFRHILAMIALQPAAPRGFVEAALDGAGIADGRESFDNALNRRSGYRLDDFRPIEEARSVTVPTLVAQVHDDFTMPPSYVQAIYDTISAEDKKLFWIEGTDLRFQGYNYFGEHPELLLEWFDTHM